MKGNVIQQTTTTGGATIVNGANTFTGTSQDFTVSGMTTDWLVVITNPYPQNSRWQVDSYNGYFRIQAELSESSSTFQWKAIGVSS